MDIEEEAKERIACPGVAGLAIVCDGGVIGGVVLLRGVYWGEAKERIVCGVVHLGVTHGLTAPSQGFLTLPGSWYWLGS